jgi:hypothetical protein
LRLFVSRSSGFRFALGRFVFFIISLRHGDPRVVCFLYGAGATSTLISMMSPLTKERSLPALPFIADGLLLY